MTIIKTRLLEYKCIQRHLLKTNDDDSIHLKQIYVLQFRTEFIAYTSHITLHD